MQLFPFNVYLDFLVDFYVKPTQLPPEVREETAMVMFSSRPTVLCKMRLPLLVAAAVWVLGIDAFVVPSCSRVTSSRLWATLSREEFLNSKTDYLSNYRTRGRFVADSPAVKASSVEAPIVDTPSAPDVPDIPDMPPVVVDTAPSIIDTPAALPDVTLDTTPRVGLTGFFKMPEVEVKMPEFKDMKLPDLSDVTLPDITLPEIPARQMGEGITFPGSGERVPTLLDFLRDSTVAPIRPEPLDTERIQSSLDIMTANFYALTGFNLPAIVEFFKVAQFGAWYLAGSVFLAWQIQTRSQSDSFERQLKEAERKAKEAAEAASLAAQGATMAKKLATTSKTNPTKVTSTESLLAQSKMDQIELEKVRDKICSRILRIAV